jgi:hypothetical protein
MMEVVADAVQLLQAYHSVQQILIYSFPLTIHAYHGHILILSMISIPTLQFHYSETPHKAPHNDASNPTHSAAN